MFYSILLMMLSAPIFAFAHEAADEVSRLRSTQDLSDFLSDLSDVFGGGSSAQQRPSNNQRPERACCMAMTA
eukprot:g2199.t1